MPFSSEAPSVLPTRRRALVTLFSLCAAGLSGCGSGSSSAGNITFGPGEDPRIAAMGHPYINPPYWLEYHQRYVTRAQQGGISAIFLGDSITEDWQKVPELWQERYGSRGAVTFGMSGDRTQQLLWRVENGTLDGSDAKLVVLMVGINNLLNSDTRADRYHAEGVALVVRAIQQKLPGAKVLLLGVLPAYESPDHPQRTRIRNLNQRIAPLDNGSTVRFLDMGPAFLNPDGTLPTELVPDGVHPSPEGYRRWADTMQPLFDELMAS
jgi:lysophospholipase L1-like esterase